MPRKTTRQTDTRHYVNYKPEVLGACLRAIKTKSITQRAASAYYKIPRSAIKNKLKKVHGKNIGRPTTFSAAEEISFAQHCTKLANFGFPFIPADLKLSIKSYLDNKGVRVSRFKNNTPGDDWVYGFLK
jgi:hypothetical protein